MDTLTVIGIVLIIASVILGVAIFKEIATPSTKIKVKLKIGDVFKGIMKITWILTKILIAALVVLTLLKLFYFLNENSFKKQPVKTAVKTSHFQPQSKTAIKNRHFKAQQHGTLFLNGGSVRVVVKQNNSKVMEFTTKYGAHFKWYKRDKYGKWSQTYPEDSGLWRLQPTKNPKVFEGEESDKSGIFISMKLKMD